MEEVEKHPWILKYCVKGERAFERTSGVKKRSSEPEK